MRLHVWCRALDVTTTPRQCYRSGTGSRFDVRGGFQDDHPGLPVTVRHGSSLSSRRLPVGLRRRSSSAAFCHIKDVCCQTNTATTVQLKLAVLVYRRLHGTAPLYMMKSCTQTAGVVSRQHLRSTSQRKMIVPRYRMDSYGRRCFAVAGPSTWTLPDSLCDPALRLSIFRHCLKTNFFCELLTRRT